MVARDADANDVLICVENVALHKVYCDESDANVLTLQIQIM